MRIDNNTDFKNIFITVKQKNLYSYIIFMLKNCDKVNTRYFVNTVPVLKKYLPSIFTCDCFNIKNKTFSEEVRETEIGHLFEHILLEYLCLLESAEYRKTVSYIGYTKWNWEKDIIGLFHIYINSPINNKFFSIALNKSLFVINEIIKETAL